MNKTYNYNLINPAKKHALEDDLAYEFKEAEEKKKTEN